MKIRHALANNRKAQIELITRSGRVYPFPYAKLDPAPSPDNRVREIYVDKELGNEAATYVLEIGGRRLGPHRSRPRVQPGRYVPERAPHAPLDGRGAQAVACMHRRCGAADQYRSRNQVPEVPFRR
jgi:hypothetical protein